MSSTRDFSQDRPTPGGEVLLYEAADGEIRVDVRLDRDTVWLTKQQMSELFGRERSVISKHVGNAFREGELDAAATCANFAQVRQEGDRVVSRDVQHYSLDVVISVGYRVKSARGTQFRIWATRVLREHLVRGYTVNAHRLRDLNQAVRLIAGTAHRHHVDLFYGSPTPANLQAAELNLSNRFNF